MVSLFVPLESKLTYLLSNLRFPFSNVRARSQADEPAVFRKMLHIEHDNQPLQVLGDMASQVMQVILDPASRYGRLRLEQVKEAQEVERRKQARLPVILQKVARAERRALLDMDGVILNGRFIVELARRTFKTGALSRYLDNPKFSGESRTRLIASLFSGVPRDVFTQTARKTPLTQGAVETVIGLRKLGSRVGVVTDSFFVASEIARRRVFADFSIAHVTRLRNDKATGEVTLAQAMTHQPQGCDGHRICKLNALRHLTGPPGFALRDVIVVGDGSRGRLSGRNVRPRVGNRSPGHGAMSLGVLTDG
jgi:glucosyl-3-phosphoglycerate synthase